MENNIVPDVAGRDPSPYQRELEARQQRQRLVRHIMQQVIAESPYAPDMEWEVWNHAHEMEERNWLPDGVTAFDVHQEYLRTWEGE